MGEYGEPQSRNETILQNMLGEDYPMLEPQSRIEILLQALLGEWQGISTDLNDKADKTDLIASGKIRLNSSKSESFYNDNSVSIGKDSIANGENSIAIGINATTDGKNSVAIGNGGSTGSENSLAIGFGTTTPYSGYSAKGSIAISSAAGGCRPFADNQIAIGPFPDRTDPNIANYSILIGVGTGRLQTKTGLAIEKGTGNIYTQGYILGYCKADAIAPGYNETITYALDDYVIYEGLLYRCTTAIDTPEEWNAEHWTETTVMNEIKRLTT